MLRAISVLVLFSSFSVPVAAQGDMSRIRGGGAPTPVAPVEPDWRAPYDEGVRAFGAGDFDTALARFTRGYELGGPATLAYDMALCLDRLERREEAVDAYRRYLTLVPDAANRGEVEARIAALERPRVASRIRSSEPAAPILTLLSPPTEVAAPIVYTGAPIEAPPPVVPATGPEWVVSWVFLALTAASAGGAAIAGAVGQSQFDALVRNCAAMLGCLDEVIASDPSHTSETAANVLWVTTGILGGITVASFLIEGFVSANPPRRTFIERAQLRIEVGAGALSLRGTF